MNTTSALSLRNQTEYPAELDEKSSLYLNFLPEIYREINFIGRFLKIFEDTFEPIVDQLEAISAYLDPLTAPKSMLPFLAYWVGWQLLPDLELEKQRSLIARSIEIYKLRGTKAGLKLYLNLYTGIEQNNIEIIDVFPQFQLGKSCLGISTYLDGLPYHFDININIRASSLLLLSIQFMQNNLHQLASRFLEHFITLLENFEQEDFQEIEKITKIIIEQQKPAWCTYQIYWQWE